MAASNIHSRPQIPPSPAYSFASTAFPGSASGILPPPPPLPKHFLSRSDVEASISAYEKLSDAAKAYRKAMSVVASTASAFGSALENCARCKGAGETADGLMNAGGLQYLIASNIHILSESFYRGFEVTLLHELDSYKEKNAENEERYKKEAREMNRELRKREQEHLKLSRAKTRNLSTFRSVLVDLTEQIDSLETLRYSHYRSAFELSQDTSLRVLDSIALVVRAEIEVFDKISQKGWEESGGLRDLIDRSPDPFATDTNEHEEGQIFSILPSASILPTPHGALSRTGSMSGASGGETISEGKYQSLGGALTHGGSDNYEEGDNQSVLSGGIVPSISNGNGAQTGMASPPSSTGWDNGDAEADADSTESLTIRENESPSEERSNGPTRSGESDVGWEPADGSGSPRG